MKVIRPVLQTAIEAGINASGERLAPEAYARLRRVGRDTTEVVFGSMARDGCGCPMVQAGLLSLDGKATSLGRSLGVTGTNFCKFTHHYDKFMYVMFPWSPDTLEVV